VSAALAPDCRSSAAAVVAAVDSDVAAVAVEASVASGFGQLPMRRAARHAAGDEGQA